MIHIKDVEASLKNGIDHAIIHSDKGAYRLKVSDDEQSVSVLDPKGEVIDTFHGDFALTDAEAEMNNKNQNGVSNFITTVINNFEGESFEN